jgi:hypothetical protein
MNIKTRMLALISFLIVFNPSENLFYRIKSNENMISATKRNIHKVLFNYNYSNFFLFGIITKNYFQKEIYFGMAGLWIHPSKILSSLTHGAVASTVVMSTINQIVKRRMNLKALAFDFFYQVDVMIYTYTHFIIHSYHSESIIGFNSSFRLEVSAFLIIFIVYYQWFYCQNQKQSMKNEILTIVNAVAFSLVSYRTMWINHRNTIILSTSFQWNGFDIDYSQYSLLCVFFLLSTFDYLGLVGFGVGIALYYILHTYVNV